MPFKKGRLEIDLHVSGIPNVSAGERLIEGLARVPGVASVKMLHEATSESKLAIETSKPTARELAVALDAAHELGLSLFGYSDRAIKAEYSRVRATQLALVVDPFEQSGGEGRHAWHARALPEMLATSLFDVGPIALRRDSVAGEPALELRGSFRPRRGNLEIEVKLTERSSGKIITASQATCEETALATCVAEMAGRLTEGLSKRLEGRSATSPAPRARAAGEVGAEKPLEIKKLALDNIFPALLGAYRERPIGRARLHNAGSRPLKNLVVTVQLPGFARSPLVTAVGDLAPRADLEIPIKIVLDRDALTAHDENRPAVVNFEVEYGLGEYRIREARSQATVIYNKNAISWKEPSSVASFVTKSVDELLGLARSWRSAISEARASHPLALPVALFRGLTDLGLRYSPDPSTPFGTEPLDYVQYPTQTLGSGGGDCDDLAVLFASAAKAVGTPVLLVTTPRHIFVAVAAGLPVQSGYILSPSRDRFLVHKSQLWVPLETTKLGSSFREAWEAAALELARWSAEPSKVSIIDLDEAWKSYPPINLSKSGNVPAASGRTKLAEEVEAELSALDRARAAAFEQQIETVEQKLARLNEESDRDGLRDRLVEERALLLAQTGRDKEAQKLLTDVSERSPADAVALNNLGNLYFKSDRADDAKRLYERALEHGGPSKQGDVAIHLNAALASAVLGDDESFGRHIVACLELGGQEQVLDLARAGYSDAPGLRGGNEPRLFLRDLGVQIRGAFVRSHRPLPRALSDGIDQAKSSNLESKPASRYLHWLSAAQ